MGGANKQHTTPRVDVIAFVRAFTRAMAGESPASLLPHEVGPQRHVRSVPPAPVPMFAWVRYGSASVLVAGWAVEWIGPATRMRWTTAEGVEYGAWIWGGAAWERREPSRSFLDTLDRSESAALVEEAAREAVRIVSR